MLHAKAAKVMKTVFCDNWDPVSGLQRQGARYVLCFDGGPRGNPGPGGSGAVVVCVGQDMAEIRICWVGSMSYAARTTPNNVAEYMGLLDSLRECLRKKWVHFMWYETATSLSSSFERGPHLELSTSLSFNGKVEG
ncbi:Ribonuclease H-like domain [Phytophthora cactorum]|nr:Ribonuclease H-like domain [Phytophthora cactorum]